MKIDNEKLYGKIGELSQKFNIVMVSYDKLEECLGALKFINSKYKDVLACDIESQGLDPVKHNMLGLAIATKNTAGVYFNVRGWSDNDIVTLIQEFNKLEAKTIFHNSIFDSPFTGIRYGVKLKADLDTLIMAHTIFTSKQYYEESLGLKALAEEYLPFGDYEAELMKFKANYCKEYKIKKAEFTYDLIPDEILIPYAIFDVICTLLLYKKFVKLIEDLKPTWSKLQEVIDIKTKANKYYIDAKIRGIKIDRAKVLELHNTWSKEREILLGKLLSMPEVKKAESIIFRGNLVKAQDKRKSKLKLSNCRKIKLDSKFNFSSNQHKQILFFEVMKLKPVEKTATGANGCGAETIEHYSNEGLEVFKILDEYTKVNKGITSFLGVEGDKGLWNLSSDEHPYVHGTHNVCGTVSSRTTTTDPNYAQMPSFGTLKQIKQCFKVEDDYNFIMMDFSAMESRMATVESQEPLLKKAYAEGLDTHCVVAWGVYKDKMELPQYEEYNDEIQEIIGTKYKKTFRQSAKVVAFGTLYGMSGAGLAKTLKISTKDAQEIIDTYYRVNSKIDEMIKKNKNDLYKNGYLENRYGARIYLRNAYGYNPESKVKNWKAIAEHRFISNFKTQGESAYYMYMCMNAFFDEIESMNLDVSLMMTIYDAIYLRVNKNIDPELIARLMYKHFAKDLDGVLMDIDPAMSNDGTWYNCEEVNLSYVKDKNFIPIKEYKIIKE